MEMGSNYLTVNSSGSPDSLNGLKFGQKIYFEDVGLGAPAAKSGGASSSTAAKKGGRGVVQNGQPPRCQVEGCKVDLSDAKTYYSRHKVCGMHSKSPRVIVNGLEQRFCQQCSRFHQLPEFDQGKRSCRRRLAGHNERRRKPPPGSLLSSRFGRLSSSLFGGNSEDPPSKMFVPGSAGGSSFSIPSGECITGVSSDSRCALSLLSNQTWGSRNRTSGIALDNSMNGDGATMSPCIVAQCVMADHLPGTNSSWGFKDNEDDASFQVVPPSDHLGLGQISQPLGCQFNGDLLMDQVHNGGRQYVEVDHSRVYNSAATSNMHWSLF